MADLLKAENVFPLGGHTINEVLSNLQEMGYSVKTSRPGSLGILGLTLIGDPLRAYFEKDGTTHDVYYIPTNAGRGIKLQADYSMGIIDLADKSFV